MTSDRIISCIILSFLLAATAGNLAAQGKHTKLNLYVQQLVKNPEMKDEQIHLLVKGDVKKIKEKVIELGGKYKYNFRNYAAVMLKVKHLEELASYAYVERLEISWSKGQPLLDRMVISNNVLPVHNGQAPLLQGYKGKDIIIGLIDTGIELAHPDFMDSLGNTKVLAIWDQTWSVDTNTPQPYGYGQEWDSVLINANLCPHQDNNTNGHGSNVSGVASASGEATAIMFGVAPESDILMVSSDFNALNWPATVADAVDWIFRKADSIGKPCVINASIGSYYGSHDGLDVATQYIDSLITAKPGRAFICAAGNSGAIPPYHLSDTVNADTSWSWFEYNPTLYLGYPGVWFEAWSDTADFNNVQFAIGMDKISPNYDFRGRTNFFNVQAVLNQTVTDSIVNNGNVLAYVDFYAEEEFGRYFLQVNINSPDSSQYNFRWMTTGSGTFDIWSSNLLGTNAITSSGLPDSLTFPPIYYYQLPNLNKSIVSNWACSDKTLTVANYVNRDNWMDCNVVLQTVGATPQDIDASSSWGPTRTGMLKPNLAATGGYTLTSGKLTQITWLLANMPNRLKEGCMHYRNGGTSMASPVVAGTAALYLQKCPKANYQDIYNAILTTTVQDAYTGAVPNTRWGYGKVNALQALATSNFTPNLSPTGIINICEDEQLNIAVVETYDSYLWSNTNTTPSIIVNSLGNYSVTVVDTNGCSGTSASTTVVLDDIPPKPEIKLIWDSLTAIVIYYPIYTYQWYRSDTVITGATDRVYLPAQTGNYSVQITNVAGCSNISDDFYFEIEGPAFAIYPNPTSGEIIVYLEDLDATEVEITIHSVLGQLVYISRNSDVSGDVKLKINIANKAKGIYFLYIRAAENILTEKIIHY